jgi:hypothetical protein
VLRLTRTGLHTVRMTAGKDGDPLESVEIEVLPEGDTRLQ